jgi:hypothetical protein
MVDIHLPCPNLVVSSNAGSESTPHPTRLRVKKKEWPCCGLGGVRLRGFRWQWQIRGTSTEVLDGSFEMFKSEFPQNRRPTVEPCWILSHFFCRRWETPLLQDISRVFGVSNDLTTAHIIGSYWIYLNVSLSCHKVEGVHQVLSSPTWFLSCISCTRGWLYMTQRGWPRFWMLGDWIEKSRSNVVGDISSSNNWWI